ncbi:hypothetical protein TCAL_09585 [Tigriopus californicus]|uniref:Tailless n=1 Tax=Tigriopus californicus TaxID=6832 RepID=A0A553PGV1_TIGCA|nr:nuclear receptor subfamily 2 group E member 1-like [Tigriopus californicus]TRY76897.1 hypothetical protein TCAL_09585 [Tigriopus californicus]
MLYHSSPKLHHVHTMASIMEQKPQQASSRILYDIPCKVCTDHSSGKHYGIFACDGCAGFFKRSIRRNRQYVCKAKSEGACVVDKTHRNQCRACRLQRCVSVGMNREAVQHERGPRNSTLRRQMSLFFKDQGSGIDSETGLPQNSSSNLMDCSPTSSPPTMPSHSPGSGITEGLGSRTALGPMPPGSSPMLHHYNVDPAMTTIPINLKASLSHLFTGPRNLGPFRPQAGLIAPTPRYMPRLGLSGMVHPMPPSPEHTSPQHHPQLPPFSYHLHSMLSNSNLGLSETAARLLFMNVRWTKHVPAFTSLPYRDQLSLLAASWRELFVLSAAQFALPIELAAMSGESLKVEVLAELKSFQEAIKSFQTLHVDPTEYACLRAIILFKTSVENNGNDASPKNELRDQSAITALQDQAQLTLSKYIASNYTCQPSRFGKLLLLLPGLRTISCNTIEHLFFRRTIGTIPLDKIICDMFRSGEDIPE